MSPALELIAHIADIAVAAIFGLLTFSFGVFCWINLENSPELHPIWTGTFGLACILALMVTVRSLILLSYRAKPEKPRAESGNVKGRVERLRT